MLNSNLAQLLCLLDTRSVQQTSARTICVLCAPRGCGQVRRAQQPEAGWEAGSWPSAGPVQEVVVPDSTGTARCPPTHGCHPQQPCAGQRIAAFPRCRAGVVHARKQSAAGRAGVVGWASTSCTSCCSPTKHPHPRSQTRLLVVEQVLNAGMWRLTFMQPTGVQCFWRHVGVLKIWHCRCGCVYVCCDESLWEFHAAVQVRCGGSAIGLRGSDDV